MWEFRSEIHGASWQISRRLNVAERSFIEQAKRIEADRAAREKPEDPGRDLELSSPDRH